MVDGLLCLCPKSMFFLSEFLFWHQEASTFSEPPGKVLILLYLFYFVFFLYGFILLFSLLFIIQSSQIYMCVSVCYFSETS